MSEDGKKVIKVSQEVSAKLPKRLVLALSGMGVILEVRETAPTILELGEALILETAVETEKISNFFESVNNFCCYFYKYILDIHRCCGYLLFNISIFDKLYF